MPSLSNFIAIENIGTEYKIIVSNSNKVKFYKDDNYCGAIATTMARKDLCKLLGNIMENTYPINGVSTMDKDLYRSILEQILFIATV